jgi:hypothetical protein
MQADFLKSTSRSEISAFSKCQRVAPERSAVATPTAVVGAIT